MAGENVLLVDDEDNLRSMLEAALRHSGFEVRSASNGRDALAAVPDLRITVLRRELRGAQVISELRFYGHFMGAFEGVRGQDQTVDFTATDTLRVERGRITDVWRGADAAAVRRALQPGSSD